MTAPLPTTAPAPGPASGGPRPAPRLPVALVAPVPPIAPVAPARVEPSSEPTPVAGGRRSWSPRTAAPVIAGGSETAAQASSGRGADAIPPIGGGRATDARQGTADGVVDGSDANLSPAAAVGSAPAPLSFEAFYQEERPRLVRAVAFALGDADLAAEAIDEAFTRAYERWPTVSQGNPPAWIYRVATNWALSILRRRRRSNHRLYDPIGVDDVVAQPEVHAALAELDPKHRSVVVCRHLLGWSVAETAAALELREGTVKSRLSRATAILHARLSHLRTEESS